MWPALLSWRSLRRRIPSVTRQLKSSRSNCADPALDPGGIFFVHIEEMGHRRSHGCKIRVVEAHRDLAVEDLELGTIPEHDDVVERRKAAVDELTQIVADRLAAVPVGDAEIA